MREINKTIYQVSKMTEPEEGINVTQLITDDLLKKSDSGEAKAVQGATQLLDRKADELYKVDEKKSRPKAVKASGAKTMATGAPKAPPVPTAKPTAKAAPKAKPVPLKTAPKATGAPAVPKTVPSAPKTAKKVVKKVGGSSTQTKKRIIKKAPVEVQSPKAKTSPVVLIAIVAVIIAIAGYVYIELA